MFEYVIAAASPFVGLFLSVRFNAFIFQWLGVSYDSWVHILIAAAFLLVTWLFRKTVTAFLEMNAYGLRPAAIAVYVISIVSSYFLRSALIYSSIEGTEISSPIILIACLIGCGILLGLFILFCARAIQAAVLPALKEIGRLKKRDWIYLLGLFLCLNLSAWLYIRLSHTVYFWDNAGYWTTTHSLAETARTGIGPLVRAVYSSVMLTDYNYIIALPGTLLCLLFGKSRYVFVAGIINIYVFPLFVIIFLYLRRRWKRYMFIVTALILLLPAVIYLSLIGFVDIAGIIPCFLAVLFYFRGKKDQPGSYIIAGCLLAIAVLLRRWYLFFALSFIICVVLDALFYNRSPMPALATLFPTGFILLFFFQKFVSYRLLADYGSMYAGYQMGLKSNFLLLFRYFGLIPIVLILAFAVYQCIRRDSRRQSLFMLIQPVICFVLFVSIQTHGQQHLFLYLPAFYWFGAQAFRVLFSSERKYIFLVSTAVPLFLTLYCLVPRIKPASVAEIESPALIADFSFKPEVRSEIDELLELTAYMDSLVEGTDKNMAILSSSITLNISVLTNVEISLSLEGCDDIDRSYILNLPAVDSRDGLPLDIWAWDYVLVASPVQTHLGEDKQRVVTVPAESFINGTDISAAYNRLPVMFTLTEYDVDIYIYEKSRDVTDEEYQIYLDRLAEALPEKF